MTQIGFTAAKRKAIDALKQGTFQHVADRSSVATKNLLLMGVVSAVEVCEIIVGCRGQHHTSSPHLQVPDVQVHVLKKDGWYIKFFFVDPDTIFLSVHK